MIDMTLSVMRRTVLYCTVLYCTALLIHVFISNHHSIEHNLLGEFQMLYEYYHDTKMKKSTRMYLIQQHRVVVVLSCDIFIP